MGEICTVWRVYERVEGMFIMYRPSVALLSYACVIDKGATTLLYAARLITVTMLLSASTRTISPVRIVAQQL